MRGVFLAYLSVSDHVEQRHDIRAAGQVLQDLDLTLDLLLFDRLQDLDDAFLVVDDVDTLEHLRVLAPAWRHHTQTKVSNRLALRSQD